MGHVTIEGGHANRQEAKAEVLGSLDAWFTQFLPYASFGVLGMPLPRTPLSRCGSQNLLTQLRGPALHAVGCAHPPGCGTRPLRDVWVGTIMNIAAVNMCVRFSHELSFHFSEMNIQE